MLYSYIERFNLEYKNIPICLDNVAVLESKLGLLYGSKVKDDLTMKPSHNLEEILAKVTGFVKLEEEYVHH